MVTIKGVYMQVNSNDVVAQAISQVNQSVVNEPAETDTNESQNVTETPTKEPVDSFSARFENLIKKEKQIMDEKKKYQEERKQWEEKLVKIQEAEDFDKLFSSNPLEALKKKGVSLDHLNEYAIKNLSDEDLDPAQLKIKSLEEKLSTTEQRILEVLQKKEEEKEKAQTEAERDKLVVEYKQNLDGFIQNNAEKYELITNYFDKDQAIDQLFEISAKYYEETNKILSPEESANLLEEYLEPIVKKMLGLNKVKSWLGSDSEDDLLALATKKAQESGTFKTLTDDYAPATKAQSNKPMSDSERLARAIEAVKGIV